MESIDKEFGESFRLARESMGLSQREVAEELKLAWKTIEDLEAENFDSLPAFVFVRGYVKNYCKLVALDSEIMASKLLDIYKSRADDSIDNTQNERNGNREGPARFSSIRIPHVLLGLLFIIIVIIIWTVDFGPKSATSVDGKNSVDSVDSIDSVSEDTQQKADKSDLAEPTTSNEMDDTSSATIESAEVSTDSVKQGWGSVVYSDQIQKPQSLEVELDQSGPAQQALAEEPENQFVDIGEEGGDELEIDFNDDCWYEIDDGQENLLTSDLGRSGETKRFRGKAPFRIKLGYAPGVAIRFNGGTVELAPYTRNNIAVFRLGRRESGDE